MSGISELLAGILRYFPNTMIASLFVLGITTGKLAWILVAIGGILVTILTLVVQYMLQKSMGLGPLTDRPGAAIIQACSLLPVAVGGDYSAMPSLWTAVSVFFATYIFMNASNIYTQTPARVNKEKLAVQQRKGMGLISMMAVVILTAFLIVPRYMSPCESKLTMFGMGLPIGMIVGAAMGITAGYAWWKILDACGPDVYPDIHGVMIGLKPGSLHTNPMACAPSKT